MTKNIEEITLIMDMMREYEKVDEIFQAGNYWKYYENNLIKQISNNDLKYFRAWSGGSGVGNIQSFHGGELELTRHFKRNFHPFDRFFLGFDNNFIVKKYNNFLNFLSVYVSFLKFFLLRASEARNYFKESMNNNLELKYELVKAIDIDLLTISDSKFGGPIGIDVDDKFYTNKFLDCLIDISTIKKKINLTEIKTILEIGAGIGSLASCFLKINSNLKYIIVDIPPILFFSEYYLKNLGFRVFGYSDHKNDDILNISKIIEEYDVVCLPTWKINQINIDFDMFVNVHSFQEMEKSQSKYYLEKIKNFNCKYLFLKNEILGMKKASKVGDFGVLDPSTLDHLEEIISSDYKKIFYKNKITDEIKGRVVYSNIYERVN